MSPPELTVLKNLVLSACLRDDADADAVAKELERVYALFSILRDRSGQMVSTLSRGQVGRLRASIDGLKGEL